MCSIPELKPLELYIGTSEAQNAVVYPLDQLPHLLVCGMNGCGHSSFLRAQTALLVHGAPAELLPIPGTALFSPINYANPVRVQTKELTDEEIETLIAPVATGHHYDDDFVREASRVESDEWPDPMYEYARQCVIEAGYASTSLLQRRCKLGYARAARIMDQMEQEKIIGPYEGAKPRAVLLTRAQWQERQLGQGE